MSWVKLDDGFHSNPKVRRAGNVGAGVYARSLSWCGAYHTDGFISRADAAMIGKTAELRRVTEAGLWEEIVPGDSRTVTGRRDSGNRPLPDVTLHFDTFGFFIADFLHNNLTKFEVEAAKAKRSAAGAKGGQASAQAPAQAFASADAQALTPALPVPSRPILLKNTYTGPDEIDETHRAFFEFADRVELVESQRMAALQLGDAFLMEAVRVAERWSGNKAAYFDGCVKKLAAAQKQWRSSMPLEDRLAAYVRNAGWQYDDATLREELEVHKGADAAMVERLLGVANEVREAA